MHARAEQALNVRGTARELVRPEIVARVFDELNESDEQALKSKGECGCE